MTDQERKTFAAEVKAGLSEHPKRLSSKWFYDEIGDELFVKIMNMPEYYLTDCEYEILSTQTTALIDSFSMPDGFDLYELGAGDGTKTIQLLKELEGKDFVYRPIDISKHAVETLTKRVSNELPEIEVKGLKGEYFQVLNTLSSDRPKVILFMGSNIGNLSDELAAQFLTQLGLILKPGDKLMLGVDLKKDKSIILPAYDDRQGFTAAFNLNLLDRINKELDGNFNRNNFVHKPAYDEAQGMAKSYIESLVDQEVKIDHLQSTYKFSKGEKLFTEISRKYDQATLKEITSGAGLKLIAEFYDSREYFCDAVFERV